MCTSAEADRGGRRPAEHHVETARQRPRGDPDRPAAVQNFDSTSPFRSRPPSPTRRRWRESPRSVLSAPVAGVPGTDAGPGHVPLDADLGGTIKGIGGALHAEGEFPGPLKYIRTSGRTRTPTSRLSTGGAHLSAGGGRRGDRGRDQRRHDPRARRRGTRDTRIAARGDDRQSRGCQGPPDHARGRPPRMAIEDTDSPDHPRAIGRPAGLVHAATAGHSARRPQVLDRTPSPGPFQSPRPIHHRVGAGPHRRASATRTRPADG